MLQAISDYTKALKINPRMAEAYQERAKVYEKIGDKKLALEDLQKVAELKK
jgi:tetratricopeptide (TPR) repeat protein